ncbi:lysoplasmalogenase TMEM86A-like [Mytilus trossulus]|uniref:lysoplasmalogenase TMEM86A-like n=1 Tax=Mytilus trossulus TaxID=6551 RepID=UPI0030067A11
MDMDMMKTKLLGYLPKPTLYPFYGTLLLYFVLYQPFIGYPPITFFAAFFKILPVLSLAYFVRSTVKGKLSALMDNDYKKFIFIGLLTSSLGDALLVARTALFIPGMLVFGVAHLFYILAFEPSSGKSRLQNLYILGYLALAVTLHADIDSFIMFCLVMVYMTLILVMSWRATNTYERTKTFPALAACVGSMLFIFSDFLIAVDKWKFSVPFTQFFVMITYYSAQFFLALSTDS